MTTVSKFIGQLGKLAGVEQADRVDRQNALVFEDELRGGGVFAKKKDERSRSWVIFRGFPATERTQYLKDLVRFMELSHYAVSGLGAHEKLEIDFLEVSLKAREANHPEVVSVMSVDSAARVATNWL